MRSILSLTTASFLLFAHFTCGKAMQSSVLGTSSSVQEIYPPGVIELKNGKEVRFSECRRGLSKDSSDYCYQGILCPPCWHKVTDIYVCYNKIDGKCPSFLGMVDVSLGSVKLDPNGNRIVV